jgi:hypothetical protein
MEYGAIAADGSIERAADTEILQSGWLRKRGGRNPAFKDRWFVLDREGRLAYAKSPAESSAPRKQDIPVAEGSVSTNGAAGLLLASPGRTYTLEASDPLERGAWLLAFAAAGATMEHDKDTQNLQMSRKGGSERGVLVSRAALDEDEASAWLRESGRGSAKSCKPGDSTPALAEVVGKAPTDRTWLDEWPAMRLEQLRLNGTVATRADVNEKGEKGGGGSESASTWRANRAAAIRWQEAEGWSADDAAAFVLISGCNANAISRALRERQHNYASSTHLVFRVLAGRAAAAPTAPPTYYYLTGDHSLAAHDPCWKDLLQPCVAVGTSFITSTLTFGRASAECFPDDKGFAEVFREPGSGKAFRRAQQSRVVRVVSRGPGDAPAEGGAAVRTLVQTAADRFEAPPLARVTLLRVVAPGAWEAHGVKVQQMLYEVSIAWQAA